MTSGEISSLLRLLCLHTLLLCLIIGGGQMIFYRPGCFIPCLSEHMTYCLTG